MKTLRFRTLVPLGFYSCVVMTALACGSDGVDGPDETGGASSGGDSGDSDGSGGKGTGGKGSATGGKGSGGAATDDDGSDDDSSGDDGSGGDFAGFILPKACGVDEPQLCNPFDSSTCAEGEACDYSDNFVECWAPPNEVQLGDACDPNQGSNCAAGLTCAYDHCAKLCCASSDCVEDETCEATDYANLGFCLAPGGAGSGGAGSGGAGSGGAGTGGTGTGDGSLPAACQATGTFDCNPLDATTCDAGEACDFTDQDGLYCFPPPNDGLLGAACDWDEPCAGGLTCSAGKCAKFCCTDSDCPAQKCSLGLAVGGELGKLSVCVD